MCVCVNLHSLIAMRNFNNGGSHACNYFCRILKVNNKQDNLSQIIQMSVESVKGKHVHTYDRLVPNKKKKNAVVLKK